MPETRGGTMIDKTVEDTAAAVSGILDGAPAMTRPDPDAEDGRRGERGAGKRRRRPSRSHKHDPARVEHVFARMHDLALVG